MVGVPDERTGQAVRAVLVLTAGAELTERAGARALRRAGWPGSRCRRSSSSSPRCRARRPASWPAGGSRAADERTRRDRAAGRRSDTRQNCSLCAKAEADVARICGELGHGWTAVDVDADPELRAEYGDRVPVIMIDGREHGFWRVEETVPGGSRGAALTPSESIRKRSGGTPGPARPICGWGDAVVPDAACRGVAAGLLGRWAGIVGAWLGTGQLVRRACWSAGVLGTRPLAVPRGGRRSRRDRTGRRTGRRAGAMNAFGTADKPVLSRRYRRRSLAVAAPRWSPPGWPSAPSRGRGADALTAGCWASRRAAGGRGHRRPAFAAGSTCWPRPRSHRRALGCSACSGGCTAWRDPPTRHRNRPGRTADAGDPAVRRRSVSRRGCSSARRSRSPRCRSAPVRSGCCWADGSQESRAAVADRLARAPLAARAPAIPAGAAFPEPAPRPFSPPNPDFYRIDTALRIPHRVRRRLVAAAARPGRARADPGFSDLLARPLVERPITLACVSNPVGGDLVSTATFVGVELRDILLEAGVRRGRRAAAVAPVPTAGPPAPRSTCCWSRTAGRCWPSA